MNLLDPLRTNLLDILDKLDRQQFPLTVGGGFGLYLKREHLDRAASPTLLKSLPEPRATNDLDLFIRVDILLDLNRMKFLADVIRRLGYEPIEQAKYMQWKKEILVHGVPQEIKLDFLVGPLGEHRAKLHVKMPRVRPRGELQFHAHTTEEALHVDHEQLELSVRGTRSSGDSVSASVWIPHPFPYLLMKLFALRDRLEDDQKDLGRHHALDVYHIVGMMTEHEYRRTVELGRIYRGQVQTLAAQQIVQEFFSDATGEGILRLKEHRLYREDFQVAEFLEVLSEVFPT